MKQLISNNPTVAMLLAFFVTSCAFAYCPAWLKVSVIGAFFLIVLFTLIIPSIRTSARFEKKLKKAFLLVCGAIAVAAAVSLSFFDLYAGKIETAAGKTETTVVRITGVDREYPYMSYYEAEVEQSELIPKKTKLILSTPVGGLDLGTVVSAEVTYSSLEERNTSTFDGKNYYRSRRVMIFAETDLIDKIGEKKRFSLSNFFDGLREDMASAIIAHCGKDTGGLAAAVLLGYRDGLAASVKRDFRRLGISHLLAISGTHFGAIITLLEFTMRRLRMRPRARACVNIFFALFFMGLTGSTPSVVRAGIMHILAQLSIIVSRKPNTVNAYAFAGAAIILINPFAVVDIGFQLSFASTFGCLAYLSARRDIIKSVLPKKMRDARGKFTGFLMKVVESALLTFTVTLFTLPLNWLYFGEISLISIPVNIIAVALVTLLLYVCGAYLVTYPLMVLIFPLSKLIDLIGGFILSSADAVSKISGVTVSTDYAFAPFLIVPLALLLISFPIVKKKTAVAGAAAVIFAVFVGTAMILNVSDRKNTYFSYVPSGSNDGFVIKSDGKVLVGDMSNASVGYSYELTAEADSFRTTEIEAVLFTHYHNKHITQFGNLCEREIVRSIVLPTPSTEAETAIYNGLCDMAEEYGAIVYTLSDGEEFSLGYASVSVYPRTYLSRTTHPVSGARVNIDGDEIVVLSSSWSEGADSMKEDIVSAEYIFLGGHSPVYKKTYSIDGGGEIKLISVSGSALEYMDEETYAGFCGVIRGEELTRLKW